MVRPLGERGSTALHPSVGERFGWSRRRCIGGMIGGIGMALMEHSVVDVRNGRVPNANFAEYAVDEEAALRWCIYDPEPLLPPNWLWENFCHAAECFRMLPKATISSGHVTGHAR